MGDSNISVVPLSSDELKILIDLIAQSSFRGSDLEIAYKLKVHLSEMFSASTYCRFSPY